MRRLKRILKVCCGAISSIMLLYLFAFNVYRAYKISGMVVSIATVIFAPVALIVWFLIVLFQDGLNAYCCMFIGAMILSFIALNLRDL